MSSFLSNFIKPSLSNLEQSSSYWQKTFSNSFKDNQTKINSMQENNSLLNTKNCSRCTQNMPKIECKACGVYVCKICDELIHNKSKFKLHNRSSMQSENNQSESTYNIRISEIKDSNQSLDLRKTLSNLSVTQKWEIIVNEIQNKFNQIINLMEERKQQLLLKLEKKKEEQLKYNMEIEMYIKSGRRNSASEDSVKKSQMSQKIQTPFSKNKVHECEHADENGKCLGKYQINHSFLNQLRSFVEKIQIKNVLSKIVCPVQQQYKKKMRSSMLLNLNSPAISNIFSSGLKSPKSPKLSQSIWVDEPKNITQKVNQQEGEASKMKLKLNDIKLLQKVKSQKIIFKNKGLDVTSARGRDTKLKKLEIMI